MLRVPDLDTRDAAEWRGADRLREARSAAGLVFDHVRRWRRPVRESRPAGRRGADRRDDERGTKTRDGEALSNALQLARRDGLDQRRRRVRLDVNFVSTSAKFPQTLDILADMLLNSTFPQDSLGAAARPAPGRAGAVAGPARCNRGARVPARALRGRPSLRPAGDRGHAQVHHPRRRRRVSRRLFPAWTRADLRWSATCRRRPSARRSRSRSPPGPPAATSHRSRTRQRQPRRRRRSTWWTSRARRSRRLRSAFPGPPRNTPDFYALQVMNTILGGQFQSRLNANIREEKGYSYGVTSSFAFGKGHGPFRAGGDIVSDEDRRRARRVHEGAEGHRRQPAR